MTSTKKLSGKAIYVVTIAAILALIGGYAVASIALTSSTQNAQGNYVSSSGAVAGVTYTSTVLGATPNPAPSASSGTPGAPQVVASGANDFCANTCTAGDFAQVVTYTFTTSMVGSIQITVQVTASAGGGTATIYLSQAGTAVGGTIVLDWDLGAATSSLTAVTLTVQECSGATCP